jgi:two-component system, NarL family, response regulator NreC
MEPARVGHTGGHQRPCIEPGECAVKNYDVVLADDHMMFRLGIKKIIEEMEGLKVIGEANDGHELLGLLNEMTPDMVILDISMPNIRGIEATREIKMIHPGIRVVILTMHNNMDYLWYSIAAGADAYVLKQDAGTDLFAAIETVRSNGVYISPTFSVGLIDDFVKKCRGDQIVPSDELTARQRVVIKLIAEGKTSKEIGALLNISIRTVEKHRAEIMKRLNLKNISDVVKYAIRKKYILLE